MYRNISFLFFKGHRDRISHITCWIKEQLNCSSFLFFLCLQQRSWPRLHLKPPTARREPCQTSPQVSRLPSACHPRLPAPHPRMASATRRATPPSAPRAKWPRWPPPRVCPLHLPWPGPSPRPGRPPSRPARGPVYLLLSPPAPLARVHSHWTIRQVSWTVCHQEKACPQVCLLLVSGPNDNCLTHYRYIGVFFPLRHST